MSATSTVSRAVKHEFLKVGTHCVVSAVGLAAFDKITKEASLPIPDWIKWIFLAVTIYRVCCIRQPKKVITGDGIPTSTNRQDYPIARSTVDTFLFAGLFMVSKGFPIPSRETLGADNDAKYGTMVASFGMFMDTLMILLACRGGFLFMDRICANGKIGKMLGSVIEKEDEGEPKLKIQ